MAKVFVIRNQDQHYLGKERHWVDGSEPQLLFRSPHHDAALNELFECVLHDPALRGDVMAVELNAQKHPVVDVPNPTEKPLPLADDAGDGCNSVPAEDVELT